MADFLLDTATRHQHFLERLKTGNANKFEKFLRMADKRVRELLTDAGTIENRRKLATLQREITDALQAVYARWDDELTSDLVEIMSNEANFELRTIEKLLGGEVDMIAPDVASMQREAFSRPFQGKTLRKLLADFADEEALRVSGVVRQGFFDGRSVSDIARDIRGTKAAQFTDGALRQTDIRARRIARTAVQHFASVARHEVYAENDDIITEYEWVAVLDSRTSSICMTLDGQVWKLGAGPLPPAHPNCVLGDTLITSAVGVSAVSKRVFEGEVVTVETVSGNKLTVTPNHPILTSKGWLAANLLAVGDKCANQTRCKGIGSVDSDDNRAFDNAEQVFEAFGASSQVSAIEVVVAAPDFHGDGVDNEVAEIRAASNLSAVLHTGIVEGVGKSIFKRTRLGEHAFPALGSVAQLSEVGLCPPPGGIGGHGEGFPVGGAGAVHSGLLLGGPAPERDPMFTKDALNGAWTDAEHIRDSCDTYAGGIEFDDVASVEVSYFSGHVYNLQTSDHCYSANGIITHNCRSTTLPIIEGEGPPVVTDSTGKRRVRGQQTYGKWLRKQPKAFQIEALGPTKAQLFRKGELAVERFTDRTNAPLTLDELRRLNPVAWAKAGLDE